MKKLLVSGLACAGLMLALPESVSAHGGQYRGPGDVVFYDQLERSTAPLEQYTYAVCIGVPRDIGQRLLHNTIECGLYLRW